MRFLLLCSLLLPVSASAKKPDIAALSVEVATSPTEGLAAVDRALAKAKTKDLAALHALRALALATGMSDPQFAEQHPNWLSELVEALAASQSSDSKDEQLAPRDMAAGLATARAMDAVGAGQIDETLLAGLEALAAQRQDPSVYVTAGLALSLAGTPVEFGSATGEEEALLERALAAYTTAAELVGTQPATPQGLANASLLAGTTARLASSMSVDEVRPLFTAVRTARAHLAGVDAAAEAELDRQLVWAGLVVTGLLPPEEALLASEAYLAAHPEDSTVWLATAMHRDAAGDLEGAEAAYLRAVAVDPDAFEANHNLGAFYVNRTLISQRALNELDLDAPREEVEALSATIRDLHLKARPHLEVAHRAKPLDPTVLHALVQVCVSLEDGEAYAAYKAKLDAVRGR